jgi:hypothetical protein
MSRRPRFSASTKRHKPDVDAEYTSGSRLDARQPYRSVLGACMQYSATAPEVVLVFFVVPSAAQID